MGLFILGIALGLVGLVFLICGKELIATKILSFVVSLVLGIIGFVLIVLSTALFVVDNQGGIILKKLGSDMPPGQIIATNGEKGPQAFVLPPGWHFGYWPWVYDLESCKNIDIPEGQVGLVTAKDGKPLPEGEVYASMWDSPQEMLDAVKFLSSGKGFRGPQLTVLPPAQYRYNPRLFNIELAPVLNVPVGKVAVIKANVGEVYKSKENEVVQEVNGVPIVPRPFRGIWNKALSPNKYYMHPAAFECKFCSSTKRIHSYVDERTILTDGKAGPDNSVSVRTKDGFKFPVDVRVSVKILAENAPYVVAMLGDPDEDANKDGFTKLEEIAVLPSIRSIFRNNAEGKEALQYVNSRSDVEKDATTKFTIDMMRFKVDVDAVYIADIGLDRTPEGQKLLATQTDKEIAVRQQATYQEQVKAEQERAKKVEAEEAANQQKPKQEAAAQVQIERDRALAKVEKARGDAAYNKEQVIALGGVENYVRLEIAKMIAEKLPQVKLPTTMVVGGGQNGSMEALMAIMLKEKSEVGPQLVP